jgi:biliverdin reductase/flavin reductase
MPPTIAVFGSTGATGRLLVEQALQRDLVVTAVARRPEAVGSVDRRLRVVGAALTESDRLADALAGADAVVSMLGVSSLRQARRGTNVYTTGTRAIVDGMIRARVSRLVVLSSSGVRAQAGDSWFYTHILRQYFLAPVYADIRAMEEELSRTDLRWTVVRAPYLTGHDERVDYRVSHDGAVPGDASLSRWTLAHSLLDVTVSAAYDKQVLSVY